jgi:predicted RNA polymerase sigma factor
MMGRSSTPPPGPTAPWCCWGEQDRTRWDRALITEGQTILRRCLGRNQPGAYQLQAAINAVHADALTVEQTDWPQIVTATRGLAPPHDAPLHSGPHLRGCVGM